MSYLETLHDLRENIQDVSLDDRFDHDPVIPALPKGSGNIWLISFTDVIALMLVFFVMMFAMSHPKQEGWVSLVQGLSQEFMDKSGATGDNKSGPHGTFDMKRIKEKKALSTNYLYAVLKHLKEENPSLKSMDITAYAKETHIVLPHNLMFKDHTLSAEGQSHLDTLTGTLGHLSNDMDIVLSGKNTSLSQTLKQSAAVAGVFTQSGYSGDIQLVSHADDETGFKLIIHAVR